MSCFFLEGFGILCYASLRSTQYSVVQVEAIQVQGTPLITGFYYALLCGVMHREGEQRGTQGSSLLHPALGAQIERPEG